MFLIFFPLKKGFALGRSHLQQAGRSFQQFKGKFPLCQNRSKKASMAQVSPVPAPASGKPGGLLAVGAKSPSSLLVPHPHIIFKLN
ncbi:hypothetical protein HMPREF0322_02563 [Desulfitobacterium hafniense DP7]|uniref:Uncharacterized protein n=1 Tax=Desulfitobacterium hafniense DP7 TaxID=537010 RepID=G9XNM0_DESHA|nr:hypothetical protein HMPREF0322_02563 [Desulfitobacterium hafniense DP7]